MYNTQITLGTPSTLDTLSTNRIKSLYDSKSVNRI
jgi:hypothetical protein